MNLPEYGTALIRCARTRCSWRGVETARKKVPGIISGVRCETSTCPTCGCESYSFMTAREIKAWERKKDYAPQAACDRFNAANPIGTSVTVQLDGCDELFKTVTRSAAQVLSGHSAVIWLESVSGCYLLDRVTPLQKRTAVKAKPVRLNYGVGYEPCCADQATHVTLNVPGPTGLLTLPIIQRGMREGSGCWTWNGSTDAPTLRPSVLTEGQNFRCHSWINNGNVQFLDDCTHEMRNQTVALNDVSEAA